MPKAIMAYIGIIPIILTLKWDISMKLYIFFVQSKNLETTTKAMAMSTASAQIMNYLTTILIKDP